MFTTTHQGTDAGQQLGESEGLAKIIIGPAVESFDPVIDFVPRGQENNRGLKSALAKLTEQGEAVLVRERPVEQIQVPSAALEHLSPLLPVCSMLDGEPFLRQTRHHKLSKLKFVLDNQD